MLRCVSTTGIALLLMLGTASAQTQTSIASQPDHRIAVQTASASQSTMANSQTGLFGSDEEQSWFASGLVGSAFSRSADDANVNLGLAVGYLFRQAAGIEFSADFAPNFVVSEVPLGETQVNSYMIDAIGALPIGDRTTIQPFVTAGLGALTLRSSDSQFGAAPGIDDNQFAWNVGAGVMGFRDRIGFRADVRYVRGSGNINDDNANGASFTGLDSNGNFLLNDVDFWRTNVGVAFRW